MANPSPSPDTRFKPGQSGNPKGRPAGSRDKLSTEFIDGLLVAFDKYGTAAIEHVAQHQPLDFLKLVASLTPKAVDVRGDYTVTHITELVSETAWWIGDVLGREAESEDEEPGPVRH